jgi:hypothetical protein
LNVIFDCHLHPFNIVASKLKIIMDCYKTQ